MAEKYTDAQHKATNAYRRKNAKVEIIVTQEEKELIRSKADEKGLSIKQYILQLVKND